MWRRIKCIWQTLSRPAKHISLGVLSIGGFLAGVIFWGGFNTALEATNTEAFCISCHEMRDNVYQELQGTIHWTNRSGVRATCPDCHVPHNWTDKIARKMQASKEVWGAIFGTIETREKFLDKRLELASHEWDRFNANGSLECKNCHSYASMNFEVMSERAQVQMRQAAERDQSCIDCHKGIAHHLPENMHQGSGLLAGLEQKAQGVSYKKGMTYYSVRQQPLYLDEALTQGAGDLISATGVTVLEVTDKALKVEIQGWRKAKGFGRVIDEAFGQNIKEAVLTKEAAQNEAVVQTFEKKDDDLTGLPWQRVTVTVWMKPQSLLADRQVLWDEANQIYTKACSVCHSQPDPAHFDANTWPGMYAGMLSFVNFDGDTQELVLKYLQKHSSDYSDGHH
ncbi:hypothetical protein VST7929_00046 [Vibrio stylophorae]|uniref:Cytochrome c-type protein n=1 Tax=Vibrio stylophorae TaxID=659351 RepID=A0ABM8ZPQ6_9VIBR|nr:pentaheme c-type cytochrome TorC [Vibrio stylophorae]CAH0532235.1 hypothetical protein VST7929_00046 [Vibrio stylophorae]